MGTPAYMAPEQHRTNLIDARADQYAFCVALYEGLYGERPFPGGNIREQLKAKMGPLPPAPAEVYVPPWLREVVVRGLSVDADNRFPSMDALLAKLSRRPTRKPRRVVLFGAAFAGLAAGAIGVIASQPGKETCAPREPAPVRGVGRGDAGAGERRLRGLGGHLLGRLARRYRRCPG